MPPIASGEGLVWYFNLRCETHFGRLGNMVPSHQPASSFPLFGKRFTVDFKTNRENIEL